MICEIFYHRIFQQNIQQIIALMAEDNNIF